MRQLFIFFAAAISLFAIDVPINHSVELDAKIGDYTIIKMPFEIKGLNSATFSLKYKEDREGDSTILSMASGDTKKEVIIDQKTGKQREVRKKVNKNKKYISIKRGHDTITLFPKKYGMLRLIVWGYKYPIVLKVRVSEEGGQPYYSFVDYEVDKKKAKTFESVPHEAVVKKLVLYMSNNKVPDGYELRGGDNKFALHGLEFSQTRELVGNLYTGDVYVVKSDLDKPIALYEEMFYSEGIYAVAVGSDELKPGEKTRLYLVRKTLHEDDEQ